MEKLDLVKTHKDYYSARQKPELLDIGPAQFLTIDGQGSPDGQPFAERLQALYGTAYALKFRYKAEGLDFAVAKLEGLWTYDEARYPGFSLSDAPGSIPRSAWIYRLMIRMPDYVDGPALSACIQSLLDKKQMTLAAYVALRPLQEGKVVQMLHVGAFAREIDTLLQMQAFMQEKGLQRNGLHHEIYLSDFRKTAPEKLRTILREPVR